MIGVSIVMPIYKNGDDIQNCYNNKKLNWSDFI